jgi:hypothetical protein
MVGFIKSQRASKIFVEFLHGGAKLFIWRKEVNLYDA